MVAPFSTPTIPPRLHDAEWVRENVFGRRISRATIHRLARQGLLPTVRVGRRMLFDETALRGWANRGGTGLQK